MAKKVLSKAGKITSSLSTYRLNFGIRATRSMTISDSLEIQAESDEVVIEQARQICKDKTVQQGRPVKLVSMFKWIDVPEDIKDRI